MLKTRFYAFFILFLIVSDWVNAGQDHSAIFDQPLSTLGGGSITVSEVLRDKPVYLKFWASWCKPCLQQMPHLQHTQETWGDKIKVIAVNIDLNETDEDIRAVQQKYGLTMPIVKDTEGQLANNTGFVGTPYHVLLNKQGKVVHKGHDASDALDHKISLLAKSDQALLDAVKLTNQAGSATPLDMTADKTHVLFMTATFCDWYLADSRPAMSQACIASQKEVNQMQGQFPNLNWQVIVSHLWTGPKELAEYRDKYDISLPLSIDTQGDLFFRYNIRHFPTILVMRDKKVVFRTSETKVLKDFLDKSS